METDYDQEVDVRMTVQITVDRSSLRKIRPLLGKIMQNPRDGNTVMLEGTQSKIRPHQVPNELLADDGSILLTIRQVAKLLQVSERTVWNYSDAGLMLKPVKLGGGRAVRWPADELRAWVRAGCPTHEQWQKIKKSNAAPHKAFCASKES
jgi:predicted DNA-binding transcriptional regulator AlpA